MQHQIAQQKLELDKEKLALEVLKAQGELNPQQIQMMLESIVAMDANLKDVGQAVATILDGLESELAPQSVPPEAAIEQPMENVVV